MLRFGARRVVDGVHIQCQQRCVAVEGGRLEQGAEEDEARFCVEVGGVGDVGGLGRVWWSVVEEGGKEDFVIRESSYSAGL